MCDECDYLVANAHRAGEAQLRAEFAELERQRIQTLIDRDRWLIVSVEDWPWPAYTVGLRSRGHPELCVFGLEPMRGHHVLDAFATQVRNGLRIRDGDDAYLGDRPFRAFAVPNPEDFLTAACSFYEERVPALQLVYSDVHGVWPWEPDCHLFPGSQPMPGEYPSPHEFAP
jgi:hypothetical protein